MQTKYAGAFISIEGGEGVGKSLLSDRLAQILKVKLGRDVIQTREPGGSQSAEAIRALFNQEPENEPFSGMSELFLVSAARCQHLKYTILPNLQAGNWVVCDRYTDSTRVYQGALGGIEEAALERVIEISTQGLQADLTLLLDCDLKTSMARVKGRTGEAGGAGEGASRYDEASFETHRRLRDAYLELAQKFPGRIKVLDASQKADKIAQQAYQVIQERLGKNELS
ncbi:MAG: dTMP kinase [Oligoflexales bacterium]|nr:dTMP kinase [Oligoflexales bacterium]